MTVTSLIEELKGKLNITWDDKDTNSRLFDEILSAKKTLDYKLGADIDYSQNGIEKTLFLNYCMYAWNNCLDEFDNRYINDIYQIRIKYEVENYEKNQIR